MNTTEIRELTDADLDIVSGGWKECSIGTTAGGGPGLYPDYANCAVSVDNLIQAFLDGVEKGKAKGGKGGKPA
jgi:hypothetical protein